jgi:hypothetical protein
MTAEPHPLVEAVRGGSWEEEPCAESDDRPLGRRAADGEVEDHRLANGGPAEPGQHARNAQVELAAARGTGHDDERGRGFTDARKQPARVEGVESRAAPPPAG